MMGPSLERWSAFNTWTSEIFCQRQRTFAGTVKPADYMFLPVLIIQDRLLALLEDKLIKV